MEHSVSASNHCNSHVHGYSKKDYILKYLLDFKNNLINIGCARMHYLAGPAPGANIVKKSSPWVPQYCAPGVINSAPAFEICAPGFQIAPLASRTIKQ